MIKKLAPWLIAALLLWRVISDPEGAATAVRHIGTFFSSLGKGLRSRNYPAIIRTR